MRKTKKVLGIMVLSFIVMTIVNKNRFSYDWQTTLFRTAMTPFTGTIYSLNYSEDNFLKVKNGSTKSEVKTLLGIPLREDCSDEGCTGIYSNQDTPTADYDRRWVSFDNNGIVDEISYEFYVD